MKINVGSMKYDLHKSDNIIFGDEDENSVISGLTNPMEGTIQILKGMPEQARQQTLWHELFHAFFDEIGAFELSNDEGLVEALAKQVHYFLQHNNLDKIYDFIGDKNENINRAKVKNKPN